MALYFEGTKLRVKGYDVTVRKLPLFNYIGEKQFCRG